MGCIRLQMSALDTMTSCQVWRISLTIDTQQRSKPHITARTHGRVHAKLPMGVGDNGSHTPSSGHNRRTIACAGKFEMYMGEMNPNLSARGLKEALRNCVRSSKGLS